jgi:hypothetical protein
VSVWWYLAIAAVIVLLVNVLVALLLGIRGERNASDDDTHLDG